LGDLRRDVSVMHGTEGLKIMPAHPQEPGPQACTNADSTCKYQKIAETGSRKFSPENGKTQTLVLGGPHA
jgi:hypothetical protein